MPSRRDVLTAMATTVAAGVAGCSSLASTQSQRPALGELTVRNHTPRPQTVHVVMREDDERVYRATERATPAEPGRVGGARFEGHPTAPGAYVLEAGKDGQPRSAWERVEFTDYEAACLGLALAVGDSTPAAREDLTVWTTTNSRLCREPSPDARVQQSALQGGDR